MNRQMIIELKIKFISTTDNFIAFVNKKPLIYMICIIFFSSRISFTSSHFHALFAAEAKFQEESAKIKNAMSDVAEKLAKESGGFNASMLHGSKRWEMVTCFTKKRWFFKVY